MDGDKQEALIIPMNMRRVRRAHRGASWVPPTVDQKGQTVEPGHHKLSLRKWLRTQKTLRLIGKAMHIAGLE